MSRNEGYNSHNYCSLHFANFLPLAERVGILTHPTKRLLMGIADGTVRDAGATPR